MEIIVFLPEDIIAEDVCSAKNCANYTHCWLDLC